MSTEETVQSSPEPQDNGTECSICGRANGPVVECELCHGSPRYSQPRHYTLTEERRGLNKEEKDERYGKYGEVGPTVVNLPGSYNPFGSKTNK